MVLHLHQIRQGLRWVVNVALQIDDAGPLMEHALLKPFLRRLPDLAR